eukprot:tig00020564_g11432.t1
MASLYENKLFQFSMLFCGPVVVGLWAIWNMFAPLSLLRFMFHDFSSLTGDEAVVLRSSLGSLRLRRRESLELVQICALARPWPISATILYYFLRMKGVVEILCGCLFFLGLRRGNNRTTTLMLVGLIAAGAAFTAIYLHAIRYMFPTGAVFGTVLPVCIWLGASLAALVFVIRYATAGSSSEGASVKVDTFFVFFLIIAPLGFLAVSIWQIAEPSSFGRFFFPSFAKSSTASFIFDSPIQLLITRWSGITSVVAVYMSVVALYGADTRTTAQIVGAVAVAISVHVISYADLFALAPQASAGPILLFIGFGGYVVVALIFLYTFYFAGHKREAVKDAAPLYSVGTPFEYA